MQAVRNHVLAALADGVDDGNDDTAREVAGKADWILRGAVKRRLEHALIDAALLTGEHVSAADPGAMRHVQRVAALNVAGRLDVDANDRHAVEVAYCESSWPLPSRAPIFTVFALVNLLGVIAGLVWLVFALRHPSHDHVRPVHVIGSGAFFHGGAPARDAQLEGVLENLTQLVIETDADRRGSVEGAPRARRVQELRDSAVIASYGSALVRDWRAMIDSLDRFADLPYGGERLRRAIDEIGRRAQAVNNRFAELGLGYYLQGDAFLQGTAHAIVFVYRVEDVTFVHAGGEPRRVLGLRKIDRLNLDIAMLGRQRNEAGDPIVMLDHIEAFVGDHVMPSLDGTPYPLGDASFANSPYGADLQAAASSAIRSELLAAGAANWDRDVILAIVTATVRRHEARHGVDLDRDVPLRYPPALAAIAGEGQLRAHLELAAYISQIGNDPLTPQLALWNLATHGFNRDQWGSAEAYAAVVVIEGLSRKLGLPTRPAVSKKGLDRAQLAATAERLAYQGDDKLRMAARQLWMEQYGEPMLPIR